MNYKKISIATSLILLILISLHIGEANINLWHLLTSADIADSRHFIFMNIRLPRVLLSAFCGALLAGAGCLTQGLFRNPIATPSILGINQAAILFVIVCSFFGFSQHSWFIAIIFIFAGAFCGLLCLLLLIHNFSGHDAATLLVSGMSLSALWGALISFFIALSAEDFHRLSVIMNWILGGLNGKGWEHLKWAVFPGLLGLCGGFQTSRKLNVLALGEETTKSLGLNMRKLQYELIAWVCLLTAAAISMAGMIPFIGLLAPHITRSLLGSEQKTLFLYSMVTGAAITTVSDLCARTVMAPSELNLGVFTSFLGVPFFLTLLWKRKFTL